MAQNKIFTLEVNLKLSSASGEEERICLVVIGSQS